MGIDVALVSDGAAVLSSLERLPRLARPPWANLGIPLIDRGRHAIVPLAVATLSQGTDPSAADELLGIKTELMMHGIHYYGGDWFHAEAQLNSEEGYGRRLVDTGRIVGDPSRLIWWESGGHAVVLVHAVDPSGALETLAFHVLPKEWVWRWPRRPATKRAASHARRMEREQAAADPSWSWPLPAR